MASIIREYLQYAPFLPRISSSSSSPGTPTMTYLPYNTQYTQVSSLPAEKLGLDDEYTNFLPLWAELSLSEKNSPYTTYKSESPPKQKTPTYLPRFQPPTQPTPQAKKDSEYASFFCKECGCPLADRYGLHDLDDDDDWKQEYEVCPLNVQTKEWARSLELLRLTEQSSKSVLGRERRRPKHLPRIDTGVSNRYRTGLQHLA